MTYEEAMEAATYGHKPLLSLVEKMKERVETELPASLRTMEDAEQYDVAGAYVDIGVYVEGDPECMVNFEEQETNPRSVRIVSAAAYSCGTSTDSVRRRGAAVAALVDILESRGIQCEVLIAMKANAYAALVTAKRSGDVLDLDRLAFAMAHPAFFRRLFFGWQDKQSEAVRRSFGYGRGKAGDYEEENAINVPKLSHGQTFASDAAAAEWVRKAVEQIDAEQHN